MIHSILIIGQSNMAGRGDMESAESLMEFGIRYYEAFKTIEDKARVFDEKSKMDDAVRSELEKL